MIALVIALVVLSQAADSAPSQVPLSGRVVGPEGQAVEGAAVLLGVTGRRAALQRATTDAEGRFQLTIPPDPQGRRALAWLTVWAYRPGSAPGGWVFTRKDPPKPGTIKLTLGKLGETRFRVVGPDGQPVSGATLKPSTYPAAGVAAEAWLPEELADRFAATTDAQGRGTLMASPAAKLTLVRVSAPGFGTQRLQLDRKGEERVVMLAPVGRLSGRLVADNPADAKGVALQVATLGKSIDNPKAGEARVTTDEQGRFRIELPPEVARDQEPVPVALWVYRPGARVAWRRLGWAVPAPEEPIRLMLKTPAATKLRVVGPEGMPIAGAKLTVTALEALPVPEALADRIAVMTNQDGTATIPAFAAEEIAAVRVEAPGFGIQRGPFPTLDGSGTGTITLKPVGHLSGRVVGADRRRRLDLLAQAQLQAKAVKDPGQRLTLLGRIAERLLDLGASTRAKALFEEGQALGREAKGIGYQRVSFAEALARVDLPAALREIDQAREEAKHKDRFIREFVYERGYGEIAYRLAARDPTTAERMLGLIHDAYRRGGYVVAACSRMAAQDLPRARRLADSSDDPLIGAYALGLMARTLASTDHLAALGLIRDAYDRLERYRDTPRANFTPSNVAAALLPVVERVEPALSPEMLWRTVALRDPWPGDFGEGVSGATVATLAMNLARYDRSIAAVVLAPAAARLHADAVATYDFSRWLMAQALIDPRQAVAQLEAMPDDPGPDISFPKNQARLSLADLLSKHGEARWQAVRQEAVSLWTPEGTDL